jgi:non-canonical (house-cleaning) NTP pyrophosphatase
MKIVIATENNAKCQAVEEVFSFVWGGCEFVPQKAASGVAEQPLIEAEGIQGAISRAEHVPELGMGVDVTKCALARFQSPEYYKQ